MRTASSRRAEASIFSGLVLHRFLIILTYLFFFFGVLPTLLWSVGGGFDVLLRLPTISAFIYRGIGVTTAIIGAVFLLWSMIALSIQGRGLPISHLAPTKIVARGPYAYIRHPIYVGYAAAFMGCGFATGSIGRGVIASMLLIAGSLTYSLGFEEPRLVRRYGNAYREYISATPLVPRSLEHALLRLWLTVRPHVEALANRVVLFHVGSTVWVTYGLFTSIGAGLALAACHVLLHRTLTDRLEAAYLFGLAIWILFGARLGALLYQSRLLRRDPMEALKRVGYVSWGGYLALFTFPFMFAKFVNIDPWWLLDRTFLPALVCSCFGRIGCLTYGCCYGRPSSAGVFWHHSDAKVNREHDSSGCVRRIPTQLFSSACAAVLVPIVAILLARTLPGVPTIIGAIFYTFGRFAIECLRDEPRFGSWKFTRGQIASSISAGIAITLLLVFAQTSREKALLVQTAVTQVRAPFPLPSIFTSTVEWLVIAACALIVFIACGVHWRRVGRW